MLCYLPDQQGAVSSGESVRRDNCLVLTHLGNFVGDKKNAFHQGKLSAFRQP